MLLKSWRGGDESAFAKIAETVNAELKRLAASYLRQERAGHTLQPTALVNEAHLRLMGGANQQDWESRSHFGAIAAKYMRQILVDYARKRGAAKRGSAETLMPLDDARVVSEPRPVDLLALDEALN